MKRHLLEEVCVRGGIILKEDLRTSDGMCGHESAADTCGHGNEPSGSTKGNYTRMNRDQLSSLWC
jgi:hypothetical protein